MGSRNFNPFPRVSAFGYIRFYAYIRTEVSKEYLENLQRSCKQFIKNVTAFIKKKSCFIWNKGTYKELFFWSILN